MKCCWHSWKFLRIILAFFGYWFSLVQSWVFDDQHLLRQKMCYKRWWLCDETWCEQTLIRLLTFCENKNAKEFSSFFMSRCKSMNFLLTRFGSSTKTISPLKHFVYAWEKMERHLNHLVCSEFTFVLLLNVQPLLWKLFLSKKISKRHKRR